MSFVKRLIKSFQALSRALGLLLATLFNWVVRRLFRVRRSRRSNTGFILPTVTMVVLVVVLLTTAIVTRSFDRAKNAGNYRVNQIVLNASTPAIERAKVKLDALFDDPTLPRGTPSDSSLDSALSQSKYSLPDEIRLVLAEDLNGGGGINVTPEGDQETMTTAWRYPVDTDGNGKFDSFTLYGIFFRNPSQTTVGGEVTLSHRRQGIEARTPPQDDGSSTSCAVAGTSADLVGGAGWYQSGGLLKRAFFVYTATVPITDINEGGLYIPGGTGNYETYKGQKGFSALEYQQDRARIPLKNNAIVYEDDLDLASGGSGLQLNGRIVTNSNLFAGVRQGTNLNFYEVSSPSSCFYTEENSKIVVGGNVGRKRIHDDLDNGPDPRVHLFQGGENNPQNQTFPDNDKSVTNPSPQLAYNNQAYEERIAFLVNAVIDNFPQTVSGGYPNQTVNSGDPQPVKELIEGRINADIPDTEEDAREAELEVWFRNRTRRVPFAEVPFGGNATAGGGIQDYGTDNLRPPNDWIYPTNIAFGGTVGANTGPAQLNLQLTKPPATDPDTVENEERLGDRILVGNNLPALWWNSQDNFFADERETQQVDNNTNWTGSNDNVRTRNSRVRQLVEVGLTERNGFWEKAAAEQPENRLEGLGGLRLVTGAGIYLPPDSDNLNTNIANGASTVIWPDSMPILDAQAAQNVPPQNAPPNDPSNPSSAVNDLGLDDFPQDSQGRYRPYLKMRATAVYHYAYQNGERPIACISSYYDPTNSKTARNRPGLPTSSGALTSGALANQENFISSATAGNSNNGITYNFVNDENTFYLNYEAQLVYPNGRLVNPLLRDALNTNAADRTLAQQSAIDAETCALKILGLSGSVSPATTPTGGFTIPHGTIQEVSFLDARQIKKADKDYENIFDSASAAIYPSQPNNTGQSGQQDSTLTNSADYPLYDLPVELRQPLEIRATVIDLDLLRRQSANNIPNGPNTEWLFPDSGIIYATRNDALPDASDKRANPSTGTSLNDFVELELDTDRVSGTDFWLDPTRRPNGILLIHGTQLGRGGTNQLEGGEEKGLIFASNLPTYIQADEQGGKYGFNLHDHQEFTQLLTGDDFSFENFYTNRTNLDPNFACRPDDTRLPNCNSGDNWRAASILSDSLTLLSDTFRFGFRNEGDYDQRNNQTDNVFINRNLLHQGTNINNNDDLYIDDVATIREQRLRNGFWDNSFVTNGLSSGIQFDTTGNGIANEFYEDNDYATTNDNNRDWDSSYFNNFVTPIQRRVNNVSEYVMETCRKLPIEECTPTDWVVGFDADNDGFLDDRIDEIDLLTGAGFDLNNDGKIVDDTDVDAPPERSITSGQLLNYIDAGGTVPVGRLGAGTTASPPLPLDNDPAAIEYQHYARRVAFARNVYGDIVVNQNLPNNTPIPLGINGSGNLDQYPYDGSALPRNNQLNNLWFRTTTNNNGQPWNNINYDNNNLYYEDPTSTFAGYSGEEDDWLLPDIIDISNINFTNNVANLLNGTSGNDATSDFAVCTVFGQSQDYEVNSGSLGGACNGGFINSANNARNTLVNFNPVDRPNFAFPANGNFTFTIDDNNPTTDDDTNNDGIVVIEIAGGTIKSGVTITLEGDQDSIFVFQPQGLNDIEFGNNLDPNAPTPETPGDGVKLALDGVNPNNIFWASRTGITFHDQGTSTNTDPDVTHQLAGNFLGEIGNPLTINVADDANIGGTVIDGGRFLGFNALEQWDVSTDSPGTNPLPTSIFGTNDFKITAITSQQAQPLLVPVLQIHSLVGDTATNANSHSPRENNNRRNDTNWAQWAGNTAEFNMILATGDSPVRPSNATFPGEYNGGLANFPRFLELWRMPGSSTLPLTIQGSFIQLFRSAYGTGPFIQIGRPDGTSGANLPNGNDLNNNYTGSFFGYGQYYRNQDGQSQYYNPPQRIWGFDVGLLSQLPDLFAERFTLPPTEDPNEYFREVNRDDEWTKALLCGLPWNETNNTLINNKAINDSERPTNFKTNVNLCATDGI